MVLDIRKMSPAPAPAPEEASVETPAAAHGDLEALLWQAASGAAVERALAVKQLRQLVPSEAGQEILWRILDSEDDPRRLAVAQMLGFHRPWSASPSGVRRLLQYLRGERDAEVAAALVWCLRQRDEVGEFLTHQSPRLAREAALGLALNSNTLGHVARALLAECLPEVERILLNKLGHLHLSLVRPLVEQFHQSDLQISNERLSPIFSRLPQVPLFEMFLEERSALVWDPQQGVAQSAAAQDWPRLARCAEASLRQRPSLELLRYLFNRCGEDERFARRHAPFLQATLSGTGTDAAPELLDHLAQLTARATEDKVVRLAQLLVELSARLEGQAESKAAELLEDLKSRSADLKLKIYHLQQGLA